MRNFKSFLREETNIFKQVGWDFSNTKAFLDREEDTLTRGWWSNRDYENIDIFGTFYVVDEMLRERDLEGILPIPNFRYADKVAIACTELKSFLNFPKTVGKASLKKSLEYFPAFEMSNDPNPHLTSLEHCPEKIIGDAYLTRLRGVSFSRCDRHLKEIQGRLTLGGHYMGPILSVLRIKGLEDFDFVNSGSKDPKREINKIIERHLHGDKDIIDCKEELMSAGYKEYAKL